jgi:hypothetical protein
MNEKPPFNIKSFKYNQRVTLYLGLSLNLFRRISDYYQKSTLSNGTTRVLRYFNKVGHPSDETLTIYLLDISSTIEEVQRLEMYLIQNKVPLLNVKIDPIVFKNKNHYIINYIHQKGQAIFLYLKKEQRLLYTFPTKSLLYNFLHIHHRTLKDCLKNKTIYLDQFIFSTSLIPSYIHDSS